eukprot:TRINITY_DN350_c1_g1_i4.p1 TRINITY_DN350_c1_g1~~TRINITY_DN350_c1_g1_i4.p1  ORF type:complete len:769 (+),score=175.33 TRINITY_DN350_c1_g1_i4:58-2364(+)
MSSSSLVAPQEPSPPMGTLILVGTGIKGIAQLTEEAAQHMKAADIVFYMVAEQLSEQWIRANHPDARDLYIWYASDKARIDTYSQMRLEMVNEVKKGKHVVGVFYGHPGVFVMPAHKALLEAKYYNFYAKMLAGVSAEDCLFADLGVDPALPGYQTFEATDMLLYQRTIDPHMHVVVWQVGCVGLSGFSFTKFNNHNFDVLVDVLTEVYGGDYELYNYVAAQFPGQDAFISKVAIKDLKENMVTSISTFYIPPKTASPINTNHVAKLLGVNDPNQIRVLRNYSDVDKDTEAQLLQEVKAAPPRNANADKLKSPPLATALGNYMMLLGVNPHALRYHRADPARAAGLFAPALAQEENDAVVFGDLVKIYAALNDQKHAVPFTHTNNINKSSVINSNKKGRLVVVGHGICGPAQLTFEAKAHIQQAEEVYYLLSDAVTEQWVRQNNPNAHDLASWYATNKPRTHSYIQMRMELVEAVRRGAYVVAVFYGHPGVFVDPGHKAIKQVREELEGCEAEMLPAISSVDCMYGDVGFDPALPGTQSFDAIDYMIHERSICTDMHIIIWQAGSLESFGIRPSALLDALIAVYGKDHPIVHYVAPQYITQESYVHRSTLGKFPVENIRSASSLYVPPLVKKDTAEKQDPRLSGFMKIGNEKHDGGKDTQSSSTEEEETLEQQEARRRARILSELARPVRTPPPGYTPTPAATHLGQYLTKLGEDPSVMAKHRADRSSTIAEYAPKMTSRERDSLLKGYDHIISLLRDSSLEIPIQKQ